MRRSCFTAFNRSRRPFSVVIILLLVLLNLWLLYYSSYVNQVSRDHEQTSVKTVLLAACMDRSNTFKIALQSWLLVSGISELIIVDWSSSIAISETVSELLQDPRITLVTVKREAKWVLSWAYNLAARFVSPESMILMVNCDTVLSADVLERHPMEEGTFYAGDWKTTTTDYGKHLKGILYIKRSYFVGVNGFDERLHSYGNDITNLYQRLNASGLSMKRFDLAEMHQVDHADSLRSSQQSMNRLKFEILINHRFQALLPPWNRNCTQTSYAVRASADKHRRFLAHRKTVVPSLESMLPENTTLAVKRQAAQIVLHAQRIPWSSLNLSTTYLIKMLPSYDSGRMLTVQVQGGLGTRLSALASGMAIAQKTGRHFRLIWIPDRNCNASFDDLFSHALDVWEAFDSGEVVGENFDCYNYVKSAQGAQHEKKILTTSEKHIYVKTKSILIHDEVTPQAMQDAFSRLRLRPRIATIVDTINTTALFGLHIRGMNCFRLIGNLPDDACIHTRGWPLPNTSKSVLTILFTTQIDIILQSNPQQKIFLATNSLTVRSELKRRYPGQIKLIEVSDCMNRSKQCLAFAAAELWILSRTIEIFGSPQSSFSQVAGYIGRKKVKYAGLHFPDLPSHHLTRSELVGNGNGIIYIAHRTSESWSIKSERSWRTAELLNSAQSFHNGLNGRVPVSLLTDRMTPIPPSHMGLFTSVHLVNLSDTSLGKVMKHALPTISAKQQQQIRVNLGKIQYLAMSPYEVTLYLDSDTWLCENLTDFTKLLGDNDILFGKTAHVKSKSHSAWDSGVILYRNSLVVKRFFRLWEELCVRNCVLSELDRKDTCALTTALDLSPLLRYTSLDPVYNFHLSHENLDDQSKDPQQLRSQQVSWPIKILHLNRIVAHQSNETCRIVNAHRHLPRVLGVTANNQPKMYYSKTECDIGTKNHCDVNDF